MHVYIYMCVCVNIQYVDSILLMRVMKTQTQVIVYIASGRCCETCVAMLNSQNSRPKTVTMPGAARCSPVGSSYMKRAVPDKCFQKGH